MESGSNATWENIVVLSIKEVMMTFFLYAHKITFQVYLIEVKTIIVHYGIKIRLNL